MITTKDPKEMIKERYDNYDIIVSSSLIKYLTEDYEYIYKPSPKNIMKKDLSMFSEVSRNAKYLVDHANIEMPGKKPKFVDMGLFAENLDRPLRNIYEIDLRAAYWKTAKKFGIVSDSTFKYYYETKSKQKKFARNMSIGCLAKKETLIECRDKNLNIVNTFTKETYPVFWNIAKYCGDVMENLKICSEDQYLFFWVDAIFILGNDHLRNDICMKINREGLEFKIEKISKIWKSENKIFVQDSKKIRKFSIPKRIKQEDVF